MQTVRDTLNFSASVAGWAASAFGSILMLMAMVERALGGRRARKLRAVLPERGLKGEKEVVTPVMYLLIISARVLLSGREMAMDCGFACFMRS